MRLLSVLKGMLANVDIEKIEFTYEFEGDSITVKCARCDENNYMWIRESHSSSILDSEDDCAIWEHWGLKTTYHVFTLGEYPEYDAIWEIKVLRNEEPIRLYGRRSLLGIK